MRYLHCTVVLSLVALAGAGTMAQAPAGARAEFTVFLRGTPIGVEEVAVNRTAEGTTITGTARLAPPVSLTVRRAEIRYDAAGKPLSCLVEGSVRDRILVVSASVTGTAASSEFTEGSDITRRTHQIAPDALLMPNVFFGSYEAFAARLSGMKPGGEVAVYIPAQGQITARLVSASDERIQTPGGPVSARRFRITLMNPAKPLDAEVWADQHGRLVRLTVPSQSLDVVRSDIASVSARREPVSHEGDVPVAIPANGFTLAGTLSRPSATPGAPQRLPAVILVGGTGPTDRDETIGGIPVLGQLANALADAGFLVVRYDRRGTGQSGGRAETAAAGDYAEDV
ncbi:MAG TPA: hypothetical protein VK943_02645, partial [Arenibaculum sp.]|nr:hypothetical protein [Arenibaculum sp.]